MIRSFLVLSLLGIHSSCKKSDKGKEEDGGTVVVPPPVDNGGNDDNGKVIECKSCKVISSAAELSALTLTAGDSVMMKKGDWNNQRLVFKGTGTAQKPIVLIAEKLGGVILKGASSIQIDGKYLEVNGLNFKNGDLSVSKLNIVDFTSSSANCSLTNTSIVDYNPADATVDYRWISVNGTNNRVDHCYVKGKKHQGATVVIWGSNANSGILSHRIDHNFFGERIDLGNNGGETIRVGTSDYYLKESNVTVEDNVFYKCSGETEIISNKMSKNIIRNNLIFESRGTLCLRHGNGTEVYGNYIIGNNVSTTGGIRIVGENHLVYNNYIQGVATTGQTCAISILDGVPNSEPSGYFQVKNVKIVGNSIVNCSQGFDIGAGKGGNNRTVPPADCTIANNLVQKKSTTTTLLTFTDAPSNFTYAGNLASAGLSLPVGLTGFTLADLKLATNSFNIYEPQTGSPVLNAFQGTFPFFTSADVGANKLDDQHKALLKAQGIGPDWVQGLGDVLIIKAQ
ncbi:polysaccharide lyase 6 family protein [Pseudopedobacter beijingensis]|uniref:Polysaccharide lyase 6 family protein n=1 Tax=Pseudopedobacter beijingensis TaxID=1207056 RepID=A0ABW4IDG2_9SPHI